MKITSQVLTGIARITRPKSRVPERTPSRLLLNNEYAAGRDSAPCAVADGALEIRYSVFTSLAIRIY